MNKRRALVLKGGTMQGAFIVGALQTIHENIKPGYFEAIFSTSVGVFEQAFFASGQTFFMENTWREYVHGRQLINFFNLFKGKPILNLDYLEELFKSEKSKLDIEAMRRSPYELKTFVLECETGEVVVKDLKRGDVFQTMKATCAVPYLYNRKVVIDGRRYLDGWVATNDNFHRVMKKALEDYDEVVAIVNNTRFDNVLRDIPDFIIRPSGMPLKSKIDTNRGRLIATIEQGKKDALSFVKTVDSQYLKNGGL